MFLFPESFFRLRYYEIYIFHTQKKYHKIQNMDFMVFNKIGVTGFEPATSTSRT